MTRLLRYIRNSIAFLFFNFLKLFFHEKNMDGKSILFINTGNLGDVMISSIILDYDKNFTQYENIYLIIKNNFNDLLSGYKGNIKIITLNHNKYRWNIFYRIKYLMYLNSLKLESCYNLTSARGITCDEIALLSGAGKIFCLNTNWEYLTKYFGKQLDSLYNQILFKHILNEYEKHIELIKVTTGLKTVTAINRESNLIDGYSFGQKISEFINNEKFIVLAPCASMVVKEYGLKKYENICNELSSINKVILIGAPNEKNELAFVARNNKNVINTAGLLKLNDILQLIAKCRLYIGNDSGFSHMALRLDVHMIAIIGGGYFNQYFPYKESKKRRYFYHRTECFGCHWKCIQHENYCLSKVLVDDILHEAKKILAVN